MLEHTFMKNYSWVFTWANCILFVQWIAAIHANVYKYIYIRSIKRTCLTSLCTFEAQVNKVQRQRTFDSTSVYGWICMIAWLNHIYLNCRTSWTQLCAGLICMTLVCETMSLILTFVSVQWNALGKSCFGICRLQWVIVPYVQA